MNESTMSRSRPYFGTDKWQGDKQHPLTMTGTLLSAIDSIVFIDRKLPHSWRVKIWKCSIHCYVCIIPVISHMLLEINAETLGNYSLIEGRQIMTTISVSDEITSLKFLAISKISSSFSLISRTNLLKVTFSRRSLSYRETAQNIKFGKHQSKLFDYTDRTIIINTRKKQS